jgi:hypothetical protein
MNEPDLPPSDVNMIADAIFQPGPAEKIKIKDRLKIKKQSLLKKLKSKSDRSGSHFQSRS